MDMTSFGITKDGLEAWLIPIKNQAGQSAVLSNFGARLVSLLTMDKEGALADVCLGFDTLEDYETRSGYLGATIGRWGNRIAGASFELNGRAYSLYANNGQNTLHGGKIGFDKKIWEFSRQGDACVIFMYTSPDGEEGFPGQLRVFVTYTLEEDGSLVLDYRAVSDADTVINLTNHAYFNLTGLGTIHGHFLQVNADFVTEADQALIPTGAFYNVKGSPYDLRRPTRLGDALMVKGNQMFDQAKGFDINYVLRGEGNRLAAELSEPVSGRVMQVYTDQPGMQVYTGQGLKGKAKGGGDYGPYSGIALETQHHPDSVHQPHFPSTVLKAGEEFRSRTVYRFTVA